MGKINSNNEIWKEVVGYEGIYQVSNLGGVRNALTQKPIYARKERYLSVYLYKHGTRHYEKIHRLVAKAFIDNPDNKPQVNHIDGNKYNNCVNNLEWCTARENAIHAVKNNLFNLEKFKRENENKKKQVIKLSDGTVYESLNECARQNKTKACFIWRVCTGKRKHYKGEQYKYLVEG